MVKLIEVDGKKYIQVNDKMVPVENVPTACNDGLFDECAQFYKVLRLYLDHGSPTNDSSLMPLFRQMAISLAAEWVAERYGEPLWKHRGISMPADASVLRIGFITQIEGALASVDIGEPLQDRASTYYQGMLNIGNGGGLTEMGKGTVKELLDCSIDALLDGGLEMPNAIH